MKKTLYERIGASVVKTVAPKHSSLPILQSVLADRFADYYLANNLEVQVEVYRLGVSPRNFKVEELAAVPASTAVKYFGEPFGVAEGKAIFGSNGTRETVAVKDSAKYPKCPSLGDSGPDKGVLAPASDFLRALAWVNRARSDDLTRPGLCGVSLEFTGSTITLVATDGHRVHSRTIYAACSSGIEGEWIMDGEVCRAILALKAKDFEGTDMRIRLCVGSKDKDPVAMDTVKGRMVFTFETGGEIDGFFVVFSQFRGIAGLGPYPDYRQVMPKLETLPSHIRVTAPALKDSLRPFLKFRKVPSVKFSQLEGSTLTLEESDKEGREVKATLETRGFDGPFVPFAVNSAYLTDIAEVDDAGELTLMVAPYNNHTGGETYTDRALYVSLADCGLEGFALLMPVRPK